MSEEFLDQFIVGSLLGDAYVSKEKRFGFTHTEKQSEYFYHKVNILKDCGLAPKIRESRTKGNFINELFVKPANTLTARISIGRRWKNLRDLWYPEGKKIVPADIKITPITLAYWYMDDGSANKRTKFTDKRRNEIREGGPWVNQFRLHLDGFDHKSQDLLQTKLKELEIDSWFYTKKDNGNRQLLITQSESKRKFKELVMPIILNVPSMLYKIDLETSFKVHELCGTETT